MCCTHTNICRHCVPACNALHLYFKMCSLPLDSDPLRPKGAPESCLLLDCLGFHTWIMGLMALLGEPWGRLDTLERISIGFLTVLVLLCISGLVEMDHWWAWEELRQGIDFSRCHICHCLSALLCVQRSFLSHDITLRGSGNIFLPQVTNTRPEHTWHETVNDK